jgi:hypothetical protein
MVSEVAVCDVLLALFVQQTVVPGGTVTSTGWNSKLTMLIMVSVGSQTPAGRAEEAWPEAGSTTSTANSASESPLPIIRAYDTTRRSDSWARAGTSDAVPNLTA